MARTRTRTFRVVPDDTRKWDRFLTEFLAGLTDVEATQLSDLVGNSVMGRAASSSGEPAAIAATIDGQALRLSGTTLGFGTLATAGLADGAVTDAKLRDSGALSVIGRASNTPGDPADIIAASDAHVLRRSGTSIGFGTVATDGIDDDAATNAKLANMAQSTIKGRAAGAGTGDPTDLTATEVATIISSAIGTALNITSGTYTPTLTIEANLDAVTAYLSQYLRVGSTVVVSGRIDIDPTVAATLTQVRISLPIASNLGATADLNGVAFASAVAGMGAAIFAVAASDDARLQLVSSGTTNQIMHFIFGYTVI